MYVRRSMLLKKKMTPFKNCDFCFETTLCANQNSLIDINLSKVNLILLMIPAFKSKFQNSMTCLDMHVQFLCTLQFLKYLTDLN